MGTFLRLSAEASSNLRGRHLTGLLVSAFSAENFIGKLSWSIFRHFVGIHSWNVRWSQKLRKIY